MSLLAQFALATFAGLPTRAVRVHGGSVQVASLERVAATPFAGDAARADERASFSLVFRGPHGLASPQGTYRVEHDDLDGFPLSLVPIAPDATGPRCEAVFA